MSQVGSLEPVLGELLEVEEVYGAVGLVGGDVGGGDGWGLEPLVGEDREVFEVDLAVCGDVGGGAVDGDESSAAAEINGKLAVRERRDITVGSGDS